MLSMFVNFPCLSCYSRKGWRFFCVNLLIVTNLIGNMALLRINYTVILIRQDSPIVRLLRFIHCFIPLPVSWRIKIHIPGIKGCIAQSGSTHYNIESL